MLESVLKSYRKLADEVDWKKYNCNDLFLEYIKHENDDLGEKFLSAIMCRYWGYAARVYNQCGRNIPFEQCYDILLDTVNYVLEKRVWEDENSSLYKDKAGPDKAFHMALVRQRSVALHHLTADKRQANFNTFSIDAAHEEYNDAAEGLFSISSEGYNPMTMTTIGEYFDKDKYLEGLILDYICFGNYDKFNYSKVVNHLKSLETSSYGYYKEVYNIKEKEYNRTINKLKKESYRMLMVKIKRLLYSLRRDYE